MDAEVVGELGADGAVHVQCLGLMAGGGEDQNEPGLQRLVEQVLRGGLTERHQDTGALLPPGPEGELGGILCGGPGARRPRR